MTEITLLSIKKRIREFDGVVRPMAEYFNQPHYMMISVILQNMGFVSCKNDNEQKEIDKLYLLLARLRSLSEYYNQYFENWVFNEVDMIIMGETCNEDQED